MKKISTWFEFKHGKNKNISSLFLVGERKNEAAADHHSFSSEKHVSHRMRSAIKLKHSFQMDSKFNLTFSPILTP